MGWPSSVSLTTVLSNASAFCLHSFDPDVITINGESCGIDARSVDMRLIALIVIEWSTKLARQ